MAAPPHILKCHQSFIATSPSDWVHQVGLDCDGRLFVWFKHGQHRIADLHRRPGRYIGVGGVPAVCCLYTTLPLAVAANLYDVAHVFPYAGEFVHAFLYRKESYVPVAPPATPCRGCATAVRVTTSLTPSTAGQVVTFTATITNADGSLPPTGSVLFSSSLDGPLGTAPVSAGQATLATSSLSVGTHTITATYAPDTGFQPASGTVPQVVNPSTVTTACCPGTGLPLTLTATFTGAIAGSYPITWDGSAFFVADNVALCGGLRSRIEVYCQLVGPLAVWFLTILALDPGACAVSAVTGAGSCVPLAINFSVPFSASGCCSAGFTCTVTT